jgi:beta-phosphoglucomutase-like phosphatase (HAD superfamily)
MSQQSLADYIAAKHKTHLIFNFDGTLAFVDIPWDKWGEELGDELHELGAELWKHYNYPGGAPFQNELVKRHGAKALNLLLRRVPLFEMPHREKFTHNEDLLRQVEGFKDMYHMFVWSSNSRQLVDSVLEQNGMGDWFDKVVTRNDLRYLKPNPEGFLHIQNP